MRGLTARQRVTVLDRVRRQLSDQPTVPSRNRKMMRANPLAQWELRIGDVRVYYDVVVVPELTVCIRAIGVKRRNRVYIADQEVEL